MSEIGSSSSRARRRIGKPIRRVAFPALVADNRVDGEPLPWTGVVPDCRDLYGFEAVLQALAQAATATEATFGELWPTFVDRALPCFAAPAVARRWMVANEGCWRSLFDSEREAGARREAAAALDPESGLPAAGGGV